MAEAQQIADDLAAIFARLDELDPEGIKGQKRPADVIGNAILVAKIATS